MLPFLTFAGGIVAGIVGVKLLKQVKPPESLGNLGDKARSGLDKAGAGLRDATVTGLSAIEKSTAKMRTKLTPPAAEPPEAVAAPTATTTSLPVTKKAAPRRKVAAKKKAAPPTATPVDPKPEGES